MNSSLASTIADYQSQINTHLDSVLADHQVNDPKLLAAMRHGLLLGGKRVRPLLVYLVGQLNHAPTGLLNAAAAAVECIHAYSLIHDDLPAMDDDELRRGQPTCHIAFDEATAILAGDALQSLAFSLIAEAPASVNAAVDELIILAETLAERYPQAHLYFDLSELRGYNYHTGIVFAAFAAGAGEAIATGGRYNDIGQVFGRARSATGFSANLGALKRLAQPSCDLPKGIFAVHSTHPAQWQAVEALRKQGQRVVCGAPGQTKPHHHQACDRLLIENDGIFEVQDF